MNAHHLRHIGVGLSAVMGLLLLSFLPGVRLYESAAMGRYFLWPWGGLMTLRWPLVLVLMALFAWALIHVIRTRRQAGTAPWAFTLAPLGLMIGLGALPCLNDILPVWLVSALVFFGPPLVGAWALVRAFLVLPGFPGLRTRTAMWAFLLAGTLLYALAGHTMSSTIGEHVGDEGHYLTQAMSLYEDGDLDLKNNLMPADVQLRGPLAFHIAPNSRAGKYYSWHSYGLSVLLAMIWPAGLWGRHLLLAFIAAGGCAGLYWLARHIGATIRSSLITVILFGLSAYWALFAFRAIPESLGATLLIFGVVGVLLQRERPWGSLFLAAAVVVSLPYAHTRFIPLSLMVWGCYGLWGLGQVTETWLRRCWRMFVFTALCGVGYGLFLYIQNRMFEASPYPVREVLFSYLPGLWRIFIDERGLLCVMPLAFVLLPAHLVWWVRDPQHRPEAAMLTAMFVACLLTACTNTSCVGGATLGGRYLFVVVPLLVPGTAWMVSRIRAEGRFLFFFMGALSAWMLWLVMSHLGEIRLDFIVPVQAMQRCDVMGGLLRGVFLPYVCFNESAPAWAAGAGVVFVLSGLGAFFFLGCRPRFLHRFGLVVLGGFVVTGVICQGYSLRNRSELPDANVVFDRLVSTDWDRAEIVRLKPGPAISLYDFMQVKFSDFNESQGVFLMYQDNGETVRAVGETTLIIPRNDWADRPYRWYTLTSPERPEPGRRVFYVEGTVEGDTYPVLAIRQGRRTLYERAIPLRNKRFSQSVEFPTRVRTGKLYYLLRLEGTAPACRITRLYWAPISPRLVTGAGIAPLTREIVE